MPPLHFGKRSPLTKTPGEIRVDGPHGDRLSAITNARIRLRASVHLLTTRTLNHHALSRSLWMGSWGRSVRKRSEWYKDEVANLVNEWATR